MLSTSIAISPRPRQNREPSSGPAARRSLLRVVSGARGAGALVAALVVLLVALLPVPTAVAPATAAAADTGTSPHLVTPELGPRAPDGGLPGDLIDRLRSTRLEGERKALADIVANGDLSKVALNRERYIAHNPLVSFRIDSGEITAQKASGRCWMFAGFNALRPEVLRKLKLKKFEFSENYLEFWDKMEKANFHLQEMIDLADRPLEDRYVEIVLHDPLGDGGWWSYFVDLVRKYGAVPKEVMPETHNSSSTHLMNKLVTLKLKQFGLELRDLARSGAKPDRLRQRKEEMLGEIYEMLALNLGRPPETFTWRYATSDSTEIVTWPETLTPRKFFDEVVGIDLDSYVSLFNYPGKEMLQPYSIELSRNLYDRPDFTFLNVPIDTLRACVLRSVLDSTAVWFACDVGQENYGKDGILALDIYNYERIYDTHFDLSKQDLIGLGLSTPNHAMTFVGADTSGTAVNKWLVENSWGDDAGDKGYWYMYNNWFDRYLFGAVIQDRYLSPELRKAARREPVVLRPWDPMYAVNRLNAGRPTGEETPPTGSTRGGDKE